MPVTPGLDELRGQARRTYRYWPIYLMLRLREVEQHLTPAQLDELGPIVGFDALASSASLPAHIPSDGRQALLVEYGLLTGEEPAIDTPMASIVLPVADTYVFRAGVPMIAGDRDINYVSLQFMLRDSSTVLVMELLRTTPAHSETVTVIAEVFSQIATDLSPEVAFEAARYYAMLHGARQLDWKPVPAHLHPQELLDATSSNGSEPVFQPRRRRGRGVFRTPN